MLAPLRLNASAIAFPRPLLAPVIKATLPVRSKMEEVLDIVLVCVLNILSRAQPEKYVSRNQLALSTAGFCPKDAYFVVGFRFKSILPKHVAELIARFLGTAHHRKVQRQRLPYRRITEEI